jgi:CsoR family transcriptional regulator, copper-sensing transcriptional repressor
MSLRPRQLRMWRRWRTARHRKDSCRAGILIQVAAATRALESVALGLLEEHIGHCVTGAVAEGGDTAAAKVKEASDASARLVRSR